MLCLGVPEAFWEAETLCERGAEAGQEEGGYVLLMGSTWVRYGKQIAVVLGLSLLLQLVSCH